MAVKYLESASFHYATLNDVTVARMVTEGCTAEDIVGQLVKDKEALLKRVMRLEMIAPRRIVMPDGRVMVCRIPDELIP